MLHLCKGFKERSMKYVTIKDIAKHLNVSISTVSRAFNDKYDIRAETRDLILKTAKEMGYNPNPMARKLVKQRSFNIGIVVPEFENSFFPKVIMGIQEVMHANGYQVLITQSNESWENEAKNVRGLVDNMADGLIISQCSEYQNLEYYNRLIERKMPLVFFNRVADELNASKVLFDDYRWAFFATEHLIVQGINNIVHLACPQKLSFALNRNRGFDDAHRKYHLKPGKTVTCGFTLEEGERVANEMVARNEVPDAIFSSSDFGAIGAMKVLKRNGYRIPEDVCVVGFSESRLADYVEPALTSVSQPKELIGKTAAELLLEQLNTNGIVVPQTVVLNGRLSIRQSSMRV